jgi:hypothetical protein
MAVEAVREVRLTETDFMMLERLEDGRNIAANLALELDRARNYLNQRMGLLLDYGLVEKIGPLEDSGLYELTERGELVLEHRDLYHRDDVDFEEFIEQRLTERRDDA